VLGLKLVVLLVLTVLFSITTSAYADGIFVEFDKSEYHTGDSLTVTGYVAELKMPVIAMSIFDPSGTILSANSVEIEPDGLFSKTLFLDSPFYEAPGEYKIKLDYGKISQNAFFTISNNDISQEVPEKPILPEITSLTTDKSTYTDNQIITISGLVSAMDYPTVLIGIYDTFGSPAGFYFGQVNSDLTFSTNFLAKAGINFKVGGTYSIKAHYAESTKTTSFNFDLSEEIISEDVVLPITDEPTITDEPPTKDEPSKNNDSSTSISNQNDQTITTSNDAPEKNAPTNKSNNNQSIIQNIPDENNDEEKPNNDSIQQDIITQDQNKKSQKNSAAEIKRADNLSVEDIELGLMLNQINLNCDSSKYADTITYYDGMGPALYRLCKFDNSLNFFNDSLMDDPNNVEILSNKASTLGKLGRISEAIIYYDKALDIDPNFLPAINNKANALANLGQYDEARKLYESVIAKNPNYTTAKENLLVLNSQIPPSVPVVLKPQLNQNYESGNDVSVMRDLTSKETSDSSNESFNFFEEISVVFSSLFGFLK